jgi:hypothetical protein
VASCGAFCVYDISRFTIPTKSMILATDRQKIFITAVTRLIIYRLTEKEACQLYTKKRENHFWNAYSIFSQNGTRIGSLMTDRRPISIGLYIEYLTITRHKASESDTVTDRVPRLDLAVSNVGSGDGAGSSSRSDVLALEVTKEAGVGRGEGTRATEGVVLAAATEERIADATAARNSEILTSSTRFQWDSHILKLVADSEGQYVYQKGIGRCQVGPKHNQNVGHQDLGVDD